MEAPFSKFRVSFLASQQHIVTVIFEGGDFSSARLDDAMEFIESAIQAAIERAREGKQ